MQAVRNVAMKSYQYSSAMQIRKCSVRSCILELLHYLTRCMRNSCMKQDTRCITLTIKNKGHATSMIFVLLTHLFKKIDTGMVVLEVVLSSRDCHFITVDMNGNVSV